MDTELARMHRLVADGYFTSVRTSVRPSAEPMATLRYALSGGIRGVKPIRWTEVEAEAAAITRIARRNGQTAQVWTTDRSPLSTIASAIKRIADAHETAREFDAGFDGGEFSGPAHLSAEHAETAAALYRLGWTATEFAWELEARTSASYAWKFTTLGLAAALDREAEGQR